MASGADVVRSAVPRVVWLAFGVVLYWLSLKGQTGKLLAVFLTPASLEMNVPRPDPSQVPDLLSGVQPGGGGPPYPPGRVNTKSAF